MFVFAEIVAASARVAAACGRLAKVREIAGLLRSLAAEEADTIDTVRRIYQQSIA